MQTKDCKKLADVFSLKGLYKNITKLGNLFVKNENLSGT
jgi:hypothetical protein